ncbi:S1 family peptidase [Actinomadura decatromicini]|uniref:S1 family peptidase n=2 Tax=Actinomadura decatromicini TaxID=2604572 RepID=A0A5D3F8E3_9ACTN|nr:S1 family peptidase [Actinomadura decatromicini]
MRTSLVRSSFSALSVASCMLLAALVVAGAPARPAAAGPDPAPSSAAGPVLLTPTPGVGEKTARSSPTMFEAIQRDLHLTRAQAITRLGRQHAADAVESRARRAAGRYFAGSWLRADASALMVAVTDQRVAQAVRAAGATPTLVAHSRGELEMARLKLRARAGKLPGKAVQDWYIDPVRNRLVVSAAPGARRAADRWVAGAGVAADLVTYEKSPRPAKLTADLVGGDGFRSRRGGCTVGFGVRPLAGGPTGFVTAGHCTLAGELITIGGQAVGNTVRSTFQSFNPISPRRLRDQAFVQVAPILGGVVPQPQPLVRTNFGNVAVLGSQAARINDILCGFGNTSQYRCGPLVRIDRDRPAEFEEAPGDVVTIRNLNDVGFCSAAGDSGGPVFDPITGQAQGTVSTSACGQPPLATSGYQPINQTQLDLNVRLLLPGQPPSFPAPFITAFSCDTVSGPPGPDGEPYSSFFCELYWDGGTDPDQVQVSTNALSANRINDYDENHVSINGKCGRDKDVFVSVSVFDAEGRRADANVNSFCPR